MTEDELLNQITVEQVLRKLPPHHAELLRMIERIEQPTDYTGPWPATYEQIGVFIGLKYEGRTLSEATVRYRRDACYRMLRAAFAVPEPEESPENPTESSSLPKRTVDFVLPVGRKKTEP